MLADASLARQRARVVSARVVHEANVPMNSCMPTRVKMPMRPITKTWTLITAGIVLTKVSMTIFMLGLRMSNRSGRSTRITRSVWNIEKNGNRLRSELHTITKSIRFHLLVKNARRYANTLRDASSVKMIVRQTFATSR